MDYGVVDGNLGVTSNQSLICKEILSHLSFYSQIFDFRDIDNRIQVYYSDRMIMMRYHMILLTISLFCSLFVDKNAFICFCQLITRIIIQVISIISHHGVCSK